MVATLGVAVAYGPPNVADKRVIGVDVGGTKILAGVVDPQGRIGHRRERTTDVTSQDELIEEIGSAAEELLDDSVEAVGFGLPSRVDQESGRVDGSVNVPLANVALRELLSNRLGLPVAIENDGNAAALAEHRVGAGQGAKTMVMLTLGTGVGGGLILGGKPYRGWFGAGAEIGHMVIVHDGVPCRCGGLGHLESYVSGKAADELAREAFGPAVDAHRLVRLATEGDAQAIELLTGIGEKLGSGIASLVNIFNPELIVIGGGFAAAGDFLFVPAQRVADREVLASIRDSYRVARAELGTSAGLIGAAMVAFEAHESAAG
jgi:glucokinase